MHWVIATGGYGLSISVVTAIVITSSNHFFWLVPALYPPNLRHSADQYRRWKWRNFLISFLHSMITGVGSLICVLHTPELLIDVIDIYLEMAYLLTSFSHGYFIYDLIEMLSHFEYKGSKELVLHHILILCCFSLTVTQKIYCGYSCIALLIELSNIFLHFRQLLLLSDTPRSSTIYRTNSYLNIGLYVLVRGLCLVWLWLTLIWVLPRVPTIPKIIAFTSLTGICSMTCILLFRIYRSDFAEESRAKADNNMNGSEQSDKGLVTNPIDIHSKSS